MRTLRRYILGEFLILLGAVLCVVMSISLAADIAERIDNVLRADLGPVDSCLYFLYRIPMMLSWCLPAAVLLASAIGLGILGRRGELDAIRMAGVNVRRLGVPVLLAALAFSVFGFVANEAAKGVLTRKAKRIIERGMLQHSTRNGEERRRIWYHDRGLLCGIGAFDERRRTVGDVSLYFQSPDDGFLKTVHARVMRYAQGRWEAETVMIVECTDGAPLVRDVERMELDLQAGFLELANGDLPLELQAWRELLGKRGVVADEGDDTAPYTTALHRCFAAPASIFVAALLGVPMGLRSRRQSGLARGLAASLGAFLAYAVLVELGSALSAAGLLPPALGVWSGSVLFVGLACLLLARTPT